MKITKIAVTTATTAALALGLAACGSASEPAKSADPQAGASTAASGPKYAGQTLTVWRLGDSNPAAQKYMDDLNAAFEKESGAKIKLEWIPWPQVNDKFTAAAAGGAGPDVTEIGNDQVPLWQSQEALAPVTPLVEAGDQAEIPKNLLGLETIDNEVYALPWGAGSRAVLYRKDWFKELDIEVPKTWDELVAAAKKIQAEKGKDVDGFAFNGGSDANHLLGAFAWSEGGEYALKEGDKWVGKVTDPKFKAGFATYTGLVTDGLSGKSRLTQNTVDIRKRFANNKVGMYLTAGWDLPGIEVDSKGKLKADKLAFFPLPAKSGGEAPSFFGGNDIAIWDSAKNKELAAEYLKMATNKEWAGRYATEGGLLPIYPEALAKLSSDPALAPFAAAFAKAKAFPADSNWTEANETKAVLQNAARSVIEGKATADEALSKANGEIEEILNQ
ncbi:MULTISPECIES: sugar ABC transporter substrate-binding protein [Streptosporangium]|uniref:N,N'-diacetylchitobiose transport system substrate-binding protein n=1 Tax=Streptosporangium brasiliense TaxID=47480 RepID=A0ABT9QWL3_9ACTN|nr:sugar ABC transporter substrate-binding protein [Streptosporangium brasiliense]MDP9861272.1 N,N'-diacetylchitobiose transport system substrate-binding protein [Streptosporangium brasiliense]